MRQIKLNNKTKKRVEDVSCDKCGKEINNFLELKEHCEFNFKAGFGSPFGKDKTITCILCKNCLYELICQFCLYDGDKK